MLPIIPFVSSNVTWRSPEENREYAETSKDGMPARYFALRLFILLGVGCSLSACLAVPVLLPPARVSIGGGVAAGEVVAPKLIGKTASGSVDLANGTTEFTTLRIDVRPLQLIPELHSRRHDAAVGYVNEQLSKGGVPSPTVSGVYFRYDHSPLLVDHLFGSATGQFRINLGITADLLQRFDTVDWGGGVSAIAGMELLRWASGEFSESDSQSGIVGVGVGEVGLGIEVQSSARFIPGMDYRAASVSFTLRTPGILALLYSFKSRNGK